MTSEQHQAGGSGAIQRWHVQAYDWPWHITERLSGAALCGAIPKRMGKRLWAAQAPISIALNPEMCCEVCYGQPNRNS